MPKRSTIPAADVEPPADPQPDEETTEPSTEEETPSGTARQRRPAAPPPALEILSDINLSTGKVSLRDFVAQKNPSDAYEKITTIAVWYKENHNLEEVNANRIYTAYRFLEWALPSDLAQVIRNLKASKKWLDKGEERGGYKVNMLGLNKVLEGFGN